MPKGKSRLRLPEPPTLILSRAKGSINARINILYFLDSLCETCLLVKSHSNSIGAGDTATNLYVDFLARDLAKIVEFVVPEGRQGLPNLTSTKQARPLPRC